jgi:hypothetical protein
VSLFIIGIEFQNLLKIRYGFVPFIPVLVFFSKFKIQIHIVWIIFQIGEESRKGVDSCSIVLDLLESFIPVFLSTETDKTVDFIAVGIKENDCRRARNVKIFPVLGISGVGVLGLDSERDVGFIDEFSNFAILPDKLVQLYAAPSRG